ncbi:MAG: hypothetical protein NTV49_08810 [Kiritimatiellaeota bacterium]|nr:hypothetical protein [Kiritimatiellota bacterium]
MLVPLPDAEQDWPISFAPSKPGPPKPVEESQIAPKIVVPDRLPSRVHRLVRDARAAFNEKWYSEHGRVFMPKGGLGLLVAPGSAKRALRIMDTLLKACETRGWTTGMTPEYRPCTIVRVQDCVLHIVIEEGLRQSPRELDEWEKKWAIEHPSKRDPYELVPNGRLKLKVCGVKFMHSGEWRDGKRRRVEDMLDDVIAHIGAAPEEKRREDEARAEAEERRREQERLRQAEEERRKERLRVWLAEKARVDELLADAEAAEQSRTVRAYIAAWIVKTEAAAGAKITPGSEADKWVTWARAQADRLDPLTESPPSLLDDKKPDDPDDDDDDDELGGLF